MKLKPIVIHGRQRWEVDLGKVDGKRVRHCFALKKAAEAFLAAKKQERANLGAQALAWSDADRADYYAAKRILGKSEVSLSQLAQEYTDRQKLAGPPKTVQEAVAECLAAKKGVGHSPNYLRQLKFTLETLAKALGGRLCATITPQESSEQLERPEWGLTRRRGVRLDWQTLFACAQRQGWVRENPVTATEAPRHGRGRPQALTPAEAKAVLESARANEPTTLPLFVLGLLAGIRPAEIARLKPAAVDRKRAIVTIETTEAKTRQRRIVTLQPVALAWLALCDPEAPLCPGHRRLEAAREKSGVKWSHDVMRHTFASYHMAQFKSADATALECGNSPRVLFEHYRELVTPEDAAEFWRIRPQGGQERKTREENS